MAILAKPDTRNLHEDEWGSRREERTFPSCTSRRGQVRRVCKQIPLIGGLARKDYADRLIERLQEGDDAISFSVLTKRVDLSQEDTTSSLPPAIFKYGPFGQSHSI